MGESGTYLAEAAGGDPGAAHLGLVELVLEAGLGAIGRVNRRNWCGRWRVSPNALDEAEGVKVLVGVPRMDGREHSGKI